MDFIFGPLPPRAEREAAKAAQLPRGVRIALDVVFAIWCGVALFAISAMFGWHSFVPDRFDSVLVFTVTVAAYPMHALFNAIRAHYARRQTVMIDR
jgi:hypothetical protein